MTTINEMRDKYLLLFADCFLVRGARRTMIADVSRAQLYFVDSSYCDILRELRSNTIGEVREMLEDERSAADFEAFINYLTRNELAVIVDDLSLFPAIERLWEHPSSITNAIIDIREQEHNFEKIFFELDELGCYHVQIRSYNVLAEEKVAHILSLAKGKHFRSIEIMTKYHERWTAEHHLQALLQLFPTTQFTVYSSPQDKWVKNSIGNEVNGVDLKLGFILYIQQEITSCATCGIINKKSMQIPSLDGFMENILLNSCLNRKISVDEEGNIKNCPSMTKSYGNIRTGTFREVLEEKSFGDIWSVNKDTIEVCKDCEYRYVCTDCRAYTLDPKNNRSKPAKCKYDPYTATWLEV